MAIGATSSSGFVFKVTDSPNIRSQKLEVLRREVANTPAPSGGSGGVSSILTKTSGYTETATSGFVVRLCDLAAGFTVVLPAASGNTAVLVFKKMQAAGTVVLDGAGAETIDGAATISLTAQYESVTLVSDGTKWSLI